MDIPHPLRQVWISRPLLMRHYSMRPLRRTSSSFKKVSVNKWQPPIIVHRCFRILDRRLGGEGVPLLVKLWIRLRGVLRHRLHGRPSWFRQRLASFIGPSFNLWRDLFPGLFARSLRPLLRLTQSWPCRHRLHLQTTAPLPLCVFFSQA